MRNRSKRKIYKLALENSNENFQLDMMNEEAGELIKAINKYKRAKLYNPEKIPETRKEISKEMADVENLLNQFKYIFGNKEDVEKYKVKKLKRLKKRILKRLENGSDN